MISDWFYEKNSKYYLFQRQKNFFSNVMIKKRLFKHHRLEFFFEYQLIMNVLSREISIFVKILTGVVQHFKPKIM